MISVRLFHPVNGESPAFDPCSQVVITGERLTLDDDEVATHQNGQWLVRGEHFTVILLDSPVKIYFEDDRGAQSFVFGSFGTVKIVDGSIRKGNDFKDVLARLDEGSKRWEVYGAPGEWLRALFLPA